MWIHWSLLISVLLGLLHEPVTMYRRFQYLKKCIFFYHIFTFIVFQTMLYTFSFLHTYMWISLCTYVYYTLVMTYWFRPAQCKPHSMVHTHKGEQTLIPQRLSQKGEPQFIFQKHFTKRPCFLLLRDRNKPMYTQHIPLHGQQPKPRSEPKGTFHFIQQVMLLSITFSVPSS